MSRLRDLYRSLCWLGGLSALILPVLVLTQPASYTDGLLLSVILASAFFLVTGSTTWLGVRLRRDREAQTGERYVLATSLRQALVVGMVTVALLVLQLLRLITPIDAALLLILGVVIELYLSSRKDFA